MKKLLTCLALSAVLFSGCTFLNRSEGIIKVNNTVITQAEFDKAFDKNIDKSFLKAFGGSKNFLKTDENPMYAIFKEKVANELIIKALFEEEIAKKGIVATKEDVENEIKLVIDKVGSKEDLNAILKQRGISNSQFKEELETQIKIKKLVKTIENIKITDSDAEKYYNNNKKQFVHSEQVRASHILVSANTIEYIQNLKAKNPDISPEEMNKKLDNYMSKQRAKAEEILKEVTQNPDNFAKIASKSSDDKASAERGGELGFFPKEAMVPEFSKAAFSMRPNTISKAIVQTPYGFHIIKVTDRIESGTTPFVKTKDEIKYFLETQRQIEVLKNLTQGLMKNAQIEYLDQSFNPKKIEKAASAKVQEQNKNKTK